MIHTLNKLLPRIRRKKNSTPLPAPSVHRYMQTHFSQTATYEDVDEGAKIWTGIKLPSWNRMFINLNGMLAREGLLLLLYWLYMACHHPCHQEPASNGNERKSRDVFASPNKYLWPVILNRI